MRYWQDLTTEDFKAADPETWVAVLPVAAIEQHGPHLPVSVDTDLANGIVDRAMTLVDPAVPALRLPTQSIGKSNEHNSYPGTLTLRTETLIGLWTDICVSVLRAGIRKLIFVNMHGGQPQVVDIVSRDMRVRHGMFCVAGGFSALGVPHGLFSKEEMNHGIHGGEFETSMMLHLRPEAVRMELADNFVPRSIDYEKEFSKLRFEGGGAGFGWMSQDNHPSGAAGDASKADADRGRLCVDHAGRGLATLIGEVSRFPLDRLIGIDPIREDG